MVLFKDELLTPTKWPLARISQFHPGADGLIRVVSIQTGYTVLNCPVNKFILLPVHDASVTAFLRLKDVMAGGEKIEIKLLPNYKVLD